MTVFSVPPFWTAIADAGRELMERRRSDNVATADAIVAIQGLCNDLLSQRGEALGSALARELVQAYQALDGSGRRAFFAMLQQTFAADLGTVDRAVDAYRKAPGPETVLALGRAAETPRRKLLRAINLAPAGTAAVIAMRRDLLDLMDTEGGSDLAPVDADFIQPLASWFNRGFLQLQRIDWETPAHILEKLIRYESVHEIQGWDDLRRRLDQDRRCFAFFHPGLPDEPLIFVEVALVNGLADAVQPLLKRDTPRGDPTQVDTAIFYSINNCQIGLRGISFGNFLIKQVVNELTAELPNLKNFATLSPVPRFSRWLHQVRTEAEPNRFGLSADQFEALSLLDHPDWHLRSDSHERLRKPVLGLCAYYLLKARHNGRPMDRVARFHLGNGAALERINWLGDCSPKGLSRSAGLLVNYRYDLKKIVEYHEAYQNKGRIACSKSVRRLLLA